jgi:DNA-binding transcriptional regulator YhcF (GntR family)
VDLLKVDGHTGIGRDTRTGAIININKKEVETARERKKKRLEAKEEHSKLIAQVDSLENEVADIKDMLTKILEKL